MKARQREFACAGHVFNLAGEVGADPVRLAMEAGRLAAAREAAREFERKMQRTLEDCPGFVGAEAPGSPDAKGKVLVEPGRVLEAMPWLKRRFHVSENLALSSDCGLCVEIIPRVRQRSGRRTVRRVSFAPPEQFQLQL